MLRARMVALEPSCREPSGRCPNLPYGLTTAPKYLSCSPVSCLRCLTPAFPSPPPRTLFPSRGPAVRSLPHSRTLPRITGRREREVGERPVCSVATSGCPTRSEDGFPAGARNIPPRPVQPSPTTASNLKNKAPRRSPGLLERLTGCKAEIPSARGNVFPPGSDSRFRRGKSLLP